VRETWARVIPIREQAAALFYERLFERHPETRTYFHGDMLAQGRKLMQMLDTAVGALDRLDALSPTLRELGRRHRDYGVTDADYDKVGEALVWALKQGLGEAFTSEVEGAWVETYVLIADIMKAGAAAGANSLDDLR
jgi:hemoglobin-like flavoprotein